MEDTVSTGMNSGGEPVGNDTQPSIDSQIQQLMSSPHYLDGKTNPLEHKRLVDSVQRLYQQKSGDRVIDNETNLPSDRTVSEMMASGDEAVLETTQRELINEAQADMDLLVEKFGLERTEIPATIWPYEASGLKCQRLIHQGHFQEAGAILKNALDELAEAGVSEAASIASTKNLLDGFLAADYLDQRVRLELGEQILFKIFNQQNDLRDQLLSVLDPDENADPKERIRQIQDLLTPSLRKANFRLYRQLLDEQTRLYQHINPGFLE